MKQISILNLIYIYNFELYGKGDIEGKIPWTYSRELTKHAKNPPLTRLHADNMLHLTKSSRLGPSFVIMNNSVIFLLMFGKVERQMEDVHFRRGQTRWYSTYREEDRLSYPMYTSRHPVNEWRNILVGISIYVYCHARQVFRCSLKIARLTGLLR